MSTDNVLELQQKAKEFFRGFCRGDGRSADDIVVRRIFLDYVGGNWSDAVIFSRIMFWQPWLIDNNRDALYKNHDEWKEDCGVNASTARKALKRMEAKGLIKTEVGRDNDGKNTVYITVNEIEFYKHLSNLDRSPISSVQSGQVHLSNLDTSSIYTNNNIHTLSPALSTKVLGIAEQVSKMQLTDPQRKTLLTWLLMDHQGKETAPLTDDMSKRVMNNLVKKGILSTDEDGNYSTTLQTTETKSILAPLTYDYFGLETNASGEPVKAEQKPFWEAAAAMVAWNKLGISWKKYQQHATPNEWMAFNGEVKQLLIRFEPWHDEKAIHPHEFQAFILKQYRSWVRDKDGFSFTTTEEAITRHFPAHRVQWRIEQAEKLEAVPA